MQPGILFCPHPPILVPEIGQGRERDALPTLEGIEALSGLANEWEFESVLCLSPHAPMFKDAACVVGFDEFGGGLDSFGMHNGLSWRLDAKLRDLCIKTLGRVVPSVLLDEQTAKSYRQGVSMDHGSAVPLTLISATHDKPIVVVAPGALSARAHYEMGKALMRAIEDAQMRVLVIASGDMAHCHGGSYSYKPEGARFDLAVSEALAQGDIGGVLNIEPVVAEDAMQCAYPSFVTALGMLDGREAQFSVHSYEAPFGVGYLTASARLTGGKGPKLAFAEKDGYVALAKGAIERFVRSGRVPAWEEMKAALEPKLARLLEGERAGAFVSLHKGGELRGCIGTISASQPTLAQEIIYCACEAAGSDPRFSPVEENELLLLDVKTDVLGKEERISSMGELDVKRYGVIVTSGYKRGLLLPDLEGVDTAEQQVAIAKRKAGIGFGEKTELSRFMVERHFSDFEARGV